MPIGLLVSRVIHEIATLILVGGLYFMLFVQLPAIAGVRSPRTRLRLRHASFIGLFRWGWLGLILLWLTAGYELHAAAGGVPAMHLKIMAALSAMFTVLFLLAQFGVFGKAVVALEVGNSERASRHYRRLRALVAVAFVLAVLVMLLDVAGPALIPADGFDLKSVIDRG